MLKIEALDVSIKSVRILRGVGFRLERGQLAGLIGRNGASKTTLMRAVVGVLPSTAGSIEFDGAPMQAVAVHVRARSVMGYMPEDRRIIPQLTIEENVCLPAWAAGTPGYKDRLKRIYEMIPEVAALRDRKGLQLSGGQQKLAALARSLMSGTKLLLLEVVYSIDRRQVTRAAA